MANDPLPPPPAPPHDPPSAPLLPAITLPPGLLESRLVSTLLGSSIIAAAIVFSSPRGPAAPAPAPGPAPAPVVDETLAEQAGEDAPGIVAYCTDFATDLVLDTLESAADCRESFQKFAPAEIKDNAAWPIIAKRLDAAVALKFDKPTIRACLAQVVQELDRPPPVTIKATAATYVYEKDAGPPPSEVLVGIDRLNRERKILASVFEEDTVDGDGEVPDQFKAPLDAARKAGLPALVATAGDKVLAVVKAPTTAAAVLEAVP